MTLTIQIEMDNAAFGDDSHSRKAETLRMLRQVLTEHRNNNSFVEGESGRIMDSNGNTVGKWEVSQ